MSDNKRPLLGISVGDPGGIGPEITAKALSLEEIYETCRPLVISDFELMKEAVKIAGVKLELNRVSKPDEGKYQFGGIEKMFCIELFLLSSISLAKMK